MATIRIDFQSSNANVPISNLRRLQEGVNSVSLATARLAQNLNTSFASARQFAESLGVSAAAANRALVRLRRLREANATQQEQFQALNQELGVSARQFRELEAAVNRAAGRFNSLDLTNLARSLNVSFTEAQRFARAIGLSADAANRAVQRLQALRQVNASGAQQFRALNQELGITARQFRELDAAVRQASRGLGQVQLGAIALSLGLVNRELVELGTNAFNVFTNLQRNLNAFAAITGATAEEVELVSDQVRELGRTTINTAQEISAATLALARAGLEAETIANLLPAVNTAAIATGTSVNDLATVLSRAVGQFREVNASQERFTEIADALVFVANRSQTNILNLGQALGFAGGTARAANQSIETTLAILGLFANAGIEASRAGTTTANVITRLRLAAAGLADPTDDASRALRRLNVEVLDEGGNLRNFATLVTEITEALRQIPVEEQPSLLEAIFERRAGRDFLNLLNLTTAEIREFAAAVQDAAGTSQQTVETAVQGAVRSIGLFNAALQDFLEAVGEDLAAILTPIIDLATGVLNVFSQLDPGIQRVVVAAGVLATVVTGLGAALAAVTLTLTALTGAQVANRLATTAAAIANGTLTASLIRQQVATAAAQAATVALTGANALLGASFRLVLAALNPYVLLLAGLTLGIGATIEAQGRLREEQRRQEAALREVADILDDLDAAYRQVPESQQEIIDLNEEIAEQNFRRLEDRITGLGRVWDNTLGRIQGVFSFAEQAAQQETFRVDDLIDDATTARALERFQELIDGFEETGSVGEDELERLTRSFEVLQEQADGLSPTLQGSIDRLNEFRATVDENAATLADLQDLVGGNADAQGELAQALGTTNAEILANTTNLEAARNAFDQLIQRVEGEQERLVLRAGRLEAQRFLEIERQLALNLISVRRAEELRLEATRQRIREQIRLEQRAIAELNSQRVADAELQVDLENQLEQRTQRISELRRELSVSERLSTTTLIEAIDNDQELLFNFGIETTNRLRTVFNEQISLLNSLASARERLNNVDLSRLQRGLEIRVALRTEELDPEQRRALQREFNRLGIEGRTTERGILQQIADLEAQIASDRLANLREEQELQRFLLNNDAVRLRLEGQRAELQARQRINEANRLINIAQEELIVANSAEDRNEKRIANATENVKLAEDNLALVQSELGLIQAQNAALDQTIDKRREILRLNQQAEQEQQQAQDEAQRAERERQGVTPGSNRFRFVSSFNNSLATAEEFAEEWQRSLEPFAGFDIRTVEDLVAALNALQDARPPRRLQPGVDSRIEGTIVDEQGVASQLGELTFTAPDANITTDSVTFPQPTTIILPDGSTIVVPNGEIDGEVEIPDPRFPEPPEPFTAPPEEFQGLRSLTAPELNEINLPQGELNINAPDARFTFPPATVFEGVQPPGSSGIEPFVPDQVAPEPPALRLFEGLPEFLEDSGTLLEDANLDLADFQGTAEDVAESIVRSGSAIGGAIAEAAILAQPQPTTPAPAPAPTPAAEPPVIETPETLPPPPPLPGTRLETPEVEVEATNVRFGRDLIESGAFTGGVRVPTNLIVPPIPGSSPFQLDKAPKPEIPNIQATQDADRIINAINQLRSDMGRPQQVTNNIEFNNQISRPTDRAVLQRFRNDLLDVVSP